MMILENENMAQFTKMGGKIKSSDHLLLEF